MKLERLSEVKYASGKTMERILKFFNSAQMTYGPGGEEQPRYTVKPDFVAQFENGEYLISDFVLGQNQRDGKFVFVNNSESYAQDWFVENIQIYKKERVL